MNKHAVRIFKIAPDYTVSDHYDGVGYYMELDAEKYTKQFNKHNGFDNPIDDAYYIAALVTEDGDYDFNGLFDGMPKQKLLDIGVVLAEGLVKTVEQWGIRAEQQKENK